MYSRELISFCSEYGMNSVETCQMDPVRERFRNKLQRLTATDDLAEIAALARGLTCIIDDIRPQKKPHMPGETRISFN
jgi:hypothetical protein